MKYIKQILLGIVLGSSYLLTTYGASVSVYSGDMYRLTTSPINMLKHGVCRNIVKTSGLDVMVPLRTSGEWNAFVSNAPGNVTRQACFVPGVACSAKPSNSSWNNVSNITQYSTDGVSWIPTTSSIHSTSTSTTECRFYCNAGYRWSGASCPGCTPGNYQPNIGQSSCIDATAGYRVPGSAATGQIACTPGNYQPNSGQSSCINASAGYYVPATARTYQTACVIGTYQNLTGQSACNSCTNKPANSYYLASSGLTSNSCPWGCNSGYSVSGSSCVPSNCSATNISGYSVPNINHGGSTNVNKVVGITNGSRTYTQGFSCSFGNTSPVGGETFTTSCNSGYYFNGSSCVPSSCGATTMNGYSIPSLTSGSSSSPSKTVSVTNGSRTCTQSFSCSLGSVSPGSESCGAITCNFGYEWNGSSCVMASCEGEWTYNSYYCSGTLRYTNRTYYHMSSTDSVTCSTPNGYNENVRYPAGDYLCSYTYSWSTGSFGTCSASPTWSSWSTCSGGIQTRTCSGTSGTQSRTVQCLRSDGVVVADGNCSGAKPSTSQSCTSSCVGSSSQTCGGTWGSPVLIGNFSEDAGPCLPGNGSQKSGSCSPVGGKNSYVITTGCNCPSSSGGICITQQSWYEQTCQ